MSQAILAELKSEDNDVFPKTVAAGVYLDNEVTLEQRKNKLLNDNIADAYTNIKDKNNNEWDFSGGKLTFKNGTFDGVGLKNVKLTLNDTEIGILTAGTLDNGTNGIIIKYGGSGAATGGELQLGDNFAQITVGNQGIQVTGTNVQKIINGNYSDIGTYTFG